MTSAHRRRIEELYQAARDPAKRAQVLAAADPELRREVESLLAQDSSKPGAPDHLVGVAGLAGPVFCSDRDHARRPNGSLQD